MCLFLYLVVPRCTGKSGTRIGTKTLALDFHAIAIIHRAAVSFLACAMFARSKFLACARNGFCLVSSPISLRSCLRLSNLPPDRPATKPGQTIPNHSQPETNTYTTPFISFLFPSPKQDRSTAKRRDKSHQQKRPKTCVQRA